MQNNSEFPQLLRGPEDADSAFQAVQYVHMHFLVQMTFAEWVESMRKKAKMKWGSLNSRIDEKQNSEEST